MAAKTKSSKSEFARKLTKMKERWSNEAGEAKSLKSFGDDLPKGTYFGRLASIELKECGDNDELNILARFVAVSGEEKGGTIARFCNLEREDGMKWAARFLMDLGVEDPEDIELDSIEETLSSLNEDKPFVKFRVVEKNGYTNVNIMKLLEEDELPEDAAEDSEQDEGTDKSSKNNEEEDEADEEDGEAEVVPKKGMEVGFMVGKKLMTGKIVSCPPNAKEVMVDTGTKKVSVSIGDLLPAEQLEEAEETAENDADEEESEAVETPEVGGKVSFEHKGKTVIAKVSAVKPKKQTLTAVAKGVTYDLSYDEVTVLAQED